MKIVKIIIAIILAIAAINSFIVNSKTEQGAGLAGVLIGVLIMISISVYLFYSATKTKKNDNSTGNK